MKQGEIIIAFKWSRMDWMDRPDIYRVAAPVFGKDNKSLLLNVHMRTKCWFKSCSVWCWTFVVNGLSIFFFYDWLSGSDAGQFLSKAADIQPIKRLTLKMNMSKYSQIIKRKNIWFQGDQWFCYILSYFVNLYCFHLQNVWLHPTCFQVDTRSWSHNKTGTHT